LQLRHNTPSFGANGKGGRQATTSQPASRAFGQNLSCRLIDSEQWRSAPNACLVRASICAAITESGRVFDQALSSSFVDSHHQQWRSAHYTGMRRGFAECHLHNIGPSVSRSRFLLKKRTAVRIAGSEPFVRALAW